MRSRKYFDSNRSPVERKIINAPNLERNEKAFRGPPKHQDTLQKVAIEFAHTLPPQEKKGGRLNLPRNQRLPAASGLCTPLHDAEQHEQKDDSKAGQKDRDGLGLGMPDSGNGLTPHFREQGRIRGLSHGGSRGSEDEEISPLEMLEHDTLLSVVGCAQRQQEDKQHPGEKPHSSAGILHGSREAINGKYGRRIHQRLPARETARKRMPTVAPSA